MQRPASEGSSQEVETSIAVAQQSSSFTALYPALNAGHVPQQSSSFTGPSPTLSAGPVPLPSNVVGVSLTAPLALPSQFMTEFTPTQSLPAESAQYYQPTTPPSGYNVTSTVGMGTTFLSGPTLPPPPTMGFVPAHGVVAGNPGKVIDV